MGSSRPAPAPASPAVTLSPREREVLRLTAQGAAPAAIAATLNLSPNTVKTYLRQIVTKLGATSRAEALRLAVAQDLVPDHHPPDRGEPLLARVLRLATEHGLVPPDPCLSPTVHRAGPAARDSAR